MTTLHVTGSNKSYNKTWRPLSPAAWDDAVVGWKENTKTEDSYASKIVLLKKNGKYGGKYQ